MRHNRDFRLVYLAVLISLAGDWFLMVALLELVLELTGKASLLGLITLAMNLPVFLVTPWAGATVDRLDRRRLMIAMNLVSAAAALLPLLATSPVRLVFAYVGVCLISLCSAYHEPAANAALPNLVAPEDLGRANVLLGTAWGSMMAIGAALGGLVTLVGGRTAAFAIDSLSFVAAALLIVRVRTPMSEGRTRSRPRIPLLESVQETVRYARAKPRVLALLVSKAGYGFVSGTMALLGMFGDKVFGRGAQGIALILVARGLGALLGPVALNAVVPLRNQCRAIAPSMAIFALGYVGLSLSPLLTLALLAVFLAHGGSSAQWQAASCALQLEVPDSLRGRVFSADHGLWTLTFSISSVGAGVLADRYGVRQAACGLAVLGLLWAVALAIATRRVWREPIAA